MAKTVTTTPATPSEEKRVSYNGQKARTGSEEYKAHGRRIKRWKKKALLAEGAEYVAATLKTSREWGAADLSKDDRGLKGWKWKALNALTADQIEALIRSME